MSNDIGAELLKKMGWQGGGLGKSSDGISEPIAPQILEGRQGLGKEKRDREILESTAKSRRKLALESETGMVTKTQEKKGHPQFYCQLCNKQYSTVKEFDGHLSSYDHHHKKRFADMKVKTHQVKPNNDEKRQAEALARRVQAATSPAVESTNTLSSVPSTFSGFRIGSASSAANKKRKRNIV